MSHGIWRMPLATEVHALQTEVGGDQNFFVIFEAQDGSIVTDAGSHQRSARPFGSECANVSNEL